MIDKWKPVDKEINHTHIYIPLVMLKPSQMYRKELLRIKCNKSFNVQGIPIVAYEIDKTERNFKKKFVGPIGGCVQNIQSLDDTSWICSEAEVYCNAFVENESFIDGIAKISGYTTLNHVMTGGITSINHSYMCNCNLQGCSSIVFSEINRPNNGKASKVKMEFQNDTNFDNVSIEFTNIPKLKTPTVKILTIDPIVDVSFKLPVAEFYVIVNRYAFDLSNETVRTTLLVALEHMNKSSCAYDVFGFLYQRRYKVPMFEGKTKPPIVAPVGVDAYASRNGYDWSGAMLEAAFAESRKQTENAANNESDDEGLYESDAACVEKSTNVQATNATEKEKINYDEKLDELKKKARDLGVEL